MASAPWLLTHEGPRRTARVRAFLDFVADSIARERPFFEERAGAA